jgi:nicotinamide-nucleotide amidase
MNKNTKTLISSFIEAKLTLGAVESLTAGLFASTFCETPGASNVFKGGLVTYWDEEKETLVGVNPKDIATCGVVSQLVANEMAEGGLTTLNVDVCVSFTGNAGPTSEPGEAKVGDVYMAIAVKKDNKVIIYPYYRNFVGERNEIRQACVDFMMDKLGSLDEVLGKK